MDLQLLRLAIAAACPSSVEVWLRLAIAAACSSSVGVWLRLAIAAAFYTMGSWGNLPERAELPPLALLRARARRLSNFSLGAPRL